MQKIHRIKIKPVHCKLGIGCGKDQKRTCRKLSRHIQSIDSTHFDVEKNQFRQHFLYTLQALHGIREYGKLDVPAALTKLPDNAECHRFIVYGYTFHKSCILLILISY